MLAKFAIDYGLKNLIDDSVEFVRTFLQMLSLLPCGFKDTEFFYFFTQTFSRRKPVSNASIYSDGS
jgi:hypothetical protein